MVIDLTSRYGMWRPATRADVVAKLDAAVTDRHPRLVATEDGTIARCAEALFSELSRAADSETQLILGLCKWVIGRLDRLETLRRLQRRGEARIAAASGPGARKLAILDLAKDLGATRSDLLRDARAFRRWFDLEAVFDRAERQKGEEEFDVSVALGRLGAVASAESDLPRIALTALRQMNERLFAARLDMRSVAATLLCLEQVARVSDACRSSMSAAFSYRVSRLALAQGSPPLVQEAALSCLCDLVPASGATALVRVLERPVEGEIFWIQRACLRLAMSKVPDTPEAAIAVELAASSPSPAVRQAVAKFRSRPFAPQDAAILRLAAEDPELKVRLAALDRLPDLLAGQDAEVAERVLAERLCAERSPAAQRMLFELVEAETWNRARAGAPDEAALWAAEVLPLLAHQKARAESDAVRRLAASAGEGVWCAATTEAFDLHEKLLSFVEALDDGAAHRLSRTLSRTMRNRELAGRVLSVLARMDFGLSLERAALGRLKLRRGERFGWRLWRFVHELRHPSTEKRQAFRHTIGRINAGHIVAPSGVLAELSQTKVPGEPLFIDEDQGWRNYLPLLDLVISATQEKSPIQIYSPEGITEIAPPLSRLGRLRSRLLLNRDFAGIADLRNAPSGDAYLAALADRGVSVTIRPHHKSTLDPRLSRHFPVVVLPIFPGLEDRWQTYVYSVYHNTLGQLAVFIALAMLWFVGRHYILSRRIRRVRRALPLVVGGWGTRGKSGTERLKAAMFNGLGLPLISKTTGCEAMFLHAEAFGETKELFLFRPFDKATIWEQARVARMGRDMGSSVVLWECMGLTPSYVSILQRQWMRDDISTITNTYPDHEDLQGPAGRNIPEVMTEFIPERSTVITTEEQMLPILREGARRCHTSLVPVDWCASMMLPDEALQRFPYAEHPANIALVLRMAEMLGLDQDRTLREMADRVVPDLGVLKTYPVARVGLRRLEFINGMSANERFGAMGNWRRTDLADHDPYADPGKFLVTVVNNRADRVPRSRVFAQILVDDFMADAHLLIGSNLNGLQGYIDEAWAERMNGFILRDASGQFLTSEAATARIEAEIRRLRVPYKPEHLAGMAAALLSAETAPVDPEALGQALEGAGADPQEANFARKYLAHRALQLNYAVTLLASARQAVDASLEERCRALFGTWFRARIHVESDYYATGEEVVARLVGLVPPNVLSRVMGIQNIKGTGLGFIYKWQDFDVQAAAFRDVRSGKVDLVETGLRKLETGPPIGRLGRDEALASLDRLEQDRIDLPPATGMRLRALREQISGQDMSGSSGKRQSSNGYISAIVGGFEGVLDVYFSIRRRNRADKIYADLARQRIGRDRAAQEIQALNAQQKGGWLLKSVGSLWTRNT